ncbi:MAG: helix-turn-helix domain-containing protein [Paracoccus sp. (in: a-proteobacteria)]|nr:helix-turn-helix domain-containing protein [Paracoccus sp. (in: a-proteobacteria)]
MAHAAHKSEAAQQAIWDHLRSAAGPETRADIITATGIAPSTVANYLKALRAAGIVDKSGCERQPQWVLVVDHGHHAPRVRADGSRVTGGNATLNLWRSMRMLGEFSARDLAAHSATPDVDVTENHAKVYCHKLLAAGYLRVVQKAAPPHRAAVYRLTRNTGPRPPKVQRVQQVFDPNTSTVHPLGGGA